MGKSYRDIVRARNIEVKREGRYRATLPDPRREQREVKLALRRGMWYDAGTSIEQENEGDTLGSIERY